MVREHIDLDDAQQRVNAVKDAADKYVGELEVIRDELAEENVGSTLGKMVGAQINMTETETRYAVKSGMPKKSVSSSSTSRG